MNLLLLHGHCVQAVMLSGSRCYGVGLETQACKAAMHKADALNGPLHAKLNWDLVVLCRTHRLGLRHMGMTLLIMHTRSVCF